MKDRELLGAAAKAAGLEIATWSNSQAGGFLKRDDSADSGKFWNPLKSYLDLYDLARRCQLTLDFEERCVSYRSKGYLRIRWFDDAESEEHAIVQAAVLTMDTEISLNDDSPRGV